MNGSSGFLSSPNFPNNFPQYSRCVWNIRVPSGYIIKVSFHHFDLGPSSYRSRVTIINVTSADGRNQFQLYGRSLPDPVYSVGNSMQVIFTSLTERSSGFNASYEAITYESGRSSCCYQMFLLASATAVISVKQNPCTQRGSRHERGDQFRNPIASEEREQCAIIRADLS